MSAAFSNGGSFVTTGEPDSSSAQETFIKGLIHNGYRWSIIRIGNSYFARIDGSDTGPYSTALQAEEFIKAIRP